MEQTASNKWSEREEERCGKEPGYRQRQTKLKKKMKEESDIVRKKHWDWTREIGTVSKWEKGISTTEGQEGWHEAKVEKIKLGWEPGGGTETGCARKEGLG